jgi:hypothetical protein
MATPIQEILQNLQAVPNQVAQPFANLLNQLINNFVTINNNRLERQKKHVPSIPPFCKPGKRDQLVEHELPDTKLRPRCP